MSEREPLIHPSQADQALRDLMPVIEWLTIADAAESDGATELAARSVQHARREFSRINEKSPAIRAYLNWLEENTVKAKRSNA